MFHDTTPLRSRSRFLRRTMAIVLGTGLVVIAGLSFSGTLAASNDDWKIVFFHHPLYSSGDRHGSDIRLREVLEPLLLKHNVSVVFNGHDHFYERVKPQQGITYFVVGSGGQLRVGNIDRRSGITAKGFDTDQVFLAVEVTGDQMYFNVISRLGNIVDSGVLMRRKSKP